MLRFAQGFSLGGEYSGAVLMSVEHAPENKRGLLSSIVNTGSALGLMLANLVFLVLKKLPEDAFMSYGWRIPFLLAGILVFFGIFIRVSLDESPEFQKVAKEGNIEKMPVKIVLTRYPKLVILMALSYLSIGTVFYILTVFSISYGTGQIDIDEALILRLILFSTVFLVAGIPFFGWLSDRYGRRRIFIAGVVGLSVLPWAWFPMFGSGNAVIMFIGFLLLFIPYCANYGTMPALFSLRLPSLRSLHGLGHRVHPRHTRNLYCSDHRHLPHGQDWRMAVDRHLHERHWRHLSRSRRTDEGVLRSGGAGDSRNIGRTLTPRFRKHSIDLVH